MSLTVINAGPGSGKSFTIRYGYRILSKQMLGTIHPTEEQETIFDFLQSEFSGKVKSACFFAHNNTTKEQLIRYLPKKTPVFTFHGAGSSTLIKRFRFQRKDETRSAKLISDITGQLLNDMPNNIKYGWLGVKKLVHYLKLEDMEPSDDNMRYIKLKYPDMAPYTLPQEWQTQSQQLLERSAIINGSVEFVDMLWLGMRNAKPIYDLGFVDESQDISNCAYKLVTRLCRNVVFCGDRNQAINAFAGASEEMYDRIKDKADAVLPLKMTLRNPPFICDLANALRPFGVIKGPNEGPGQHESVEYNDFGKFLVDRCKPNNTLIISRTNAAIISCAIMLNKKGVPCRIVDKQLSEEVLKFFKSFQTQNLTKLRTRIQEYLTRGQRSRNDMWVQMVEDKCQYSFELLDNVKTFGELEDLITETFEVHEDGYALCTIHKSKGLEATNICVLNPPVELDCAMKHPIGREQEINLHFVAITRVASNLYWIRKK